MHLTPLAEVIWQSKYRYAGGAAGADQSFADTQRRVCRAVAAAEVHAERWKSAFSGILEDFLFLPGGRIWAGAGTDRDVTLFNCFVAGPVRDSTAAIADSLRETAVTLQQGGGVGVDFSTLRPSGSPARRTGQVASGPVSFMHVWDSLCQTMLSTSTRRGAMMGTLRCDHPDIEVFVDAKRDEHALRNFNLSVLITDAFMQAVASDAEWQLVYPAETAVAGADNEGSHSASPARGHSQRRLPARELWRRMAAAAHETAEPGLLFIDTINRNNNLSWCETISATNPCGEIPLPPYGSCNLGSVNLAALVRAPFQSAAQFEWDRLRETVHIAVRFLDDVIDVSRFPLERQAEYARATRRVGIGVTGLADALAMLGLHYDSDAARSFASRLMEQVRDEAYAASIQLAGEKGAFPLFDPDKYLQSPFIRRLPEALRAGIAAHGLRNSHLLAVAPAGTISLLAGNVSSGIEPIYALESMRDIRGADLELHRMSAPDFAWERWLKDHGAGTKVPSAFVTADALPTRAHLAMQAGLQPFVDNAISKTVNLAAEAEVEDVESLYAAAYELGLKGCTVFRPGTARGQVIRAREASHCCHIEREAD
jgi:ribonucleoside-diphosphate reductase alpha chain